MNKLIELFKNAGLSQDILSELIDISVVKSVKNQEVVIQYQQVCQELFFVIEGGFIVQYIDEHSRNPRTVNFNLDTFQPYLVCVESFYNQTPSEFRVKAFQNAKIMVFPKEKLFALMDKYVEIKDVYLDLVTKSLIEENNFRVKLLTLPPEDMYAFIRDQFPDLTLRVPSKYIAEFIGISPEWLSKIKRKDAIS